MTTTPGPIGKRLFVEDHLTGLDADANGRIVLYRTAFNDKRGQAAVLAWCEQHNLGQQEKLMRQVAARRREALNDLSTQGYGVQRVTVTPATRWLLGQGEKANAYEVGFALHGTYGWPCLRGSSLKGLAHAWAVEAKEDIAYRLEVFGGPRPGETTNDESKRGTVAFLDALPDKPAQIVRDVLTPHVQPYYTDPEHRVPPAEHYNPVLVDLLAVESGAFTVDLVSNDDDTTASEMAAQWLTAAAEEMGLGGKTSAGYGYATTASEIERRGGGAE